MIEQVRNFIIQCPNLRKDGHDFAVVGVDHLGKEPSTYSIEPTPTTEWVKKYLGGKTGIKQFDFVFASLDHYSPDEINNMGNLQFFNKFSNWVDDQQLPVKWTKFQISSAPFLFWIDESMQRARYQIQCKVIYLYDGSEK